MDSAEFVTKPIKNFAKDSIRLINRCQKPDRKGEQLLLFWDVTLGSSAVVLAFELLHFSLHKELI